MSVRFPGLTFCPSPPLCEGDDPSHCMNASFWCVFACMRVCVCVVTLCLDEVKDFACDLPNGIIIRDFGLFIQSFQLTQQHQHPGSTGNKENHHNRQSTPSSKLTT